LLSRADRARGRRGAVPSAPGRLYRRTGKRQQAHEHLNTAATEYGEMDMRFWLAKAEAEMKELA
jgi:hypothetical protein